MRRDRFEQVTARYASLRIAVVGDYCLDRYLEIDPARGEISIETNLPVHNVVRVRSQPGGAGTILNNLCALGIGTVHVLGFCGDDGEGYELTRALKAKPGAHLEGFIQTTERRTFTYCKPLLMHPGVPPEELSRLDSKNWSPTPESVSGAIAKHLESLVHNLDAIILLDQVDIPDTGVVTSKLLETVEQIARTNPNLLILADSRRGLRDFPRVTFKMNRVEFCRLAGLSEATDAAGLLPEISAWARSQKQRLFVSLAEEGILGVSASGAIAQRPSLPLRGPIDIVGAGDSVTANLTASMASGAELAEAIELANAAASLVIHQVGTTGEASIAQIRELLDSQNLWS